jgi:hypothetical protein
MYPGGTEKEDFRSYHTRDWQKETKTETTIKKEETERDCTTSSNYQATADAGTRESEKYGLGRYKESNDSAGH